LPKLSSTLLIPGKDRGREELLVSVAKRSATASKNPPGSSATLILLVPHSYAYGCTPPIVNASAPASWSREFGSSSVGEREQALNIRELL